MINLCFSAGAFQTVKRKAQKAVTRVKADKKLCLLTSECAQGDTHTHTQPADLQHIWWKSFIFWTSALLSDQQKGQQNTHRKIQGGQK